MSYKFDGKYLKYRGRIIANVRGDKIREGTGGNPLANVRGNKVREGSGGKPLINLRGRDVREGSGGRKLINLDDIDDLIDGPGGVTKAALWYLFIK